jgi:hypothetical protein
LLYKVGAEWKPVENASGYGVAKDEVNKITFKPVTTQGLRVELTAQHGVSIGIVEWRAK